MRFAVVLLAGLACRSTTPLHQDRIELHEIPIATKLSGECNVLAKAGATLHGTSLTAGIDHFVAAFRTQRQETR